MLGNALSISIGRPSISIMGTFGTWAAICLQQRVATCGKFTVYRCCSAGGVLRRSDWYLVPPFPPGLVEYCNLDGKSVSVRLLLWTFRRSIFMELLAA